jgi:hypothetical protein
MRTIKTYCKRALFYCALTKHSPDLNGDAMTKLYSLTCFAIAN